MIKADIFGDTGASDADLDSLSEHFEKGLEEFILGIDRSTYQLQQASFNLRSSGYESELPTIFSMKVCALAEVLAKKKLVDPREIILQFLRNTLIASTYIPQVEYHATDYLRSCTEAFGEYSCFAKEAFVQLLVDVLMRLYKTPGKLAHVSIFQDTDADIAWGIVGAISMIPFQTDDDMLAIAHGLRSFFQMYKIDVAFTKHRLLQLVVLLRASTEAENLFGVQPHAYHTPTLFSQTFGDVLFSAESNILVKLVQEDVSMVQSYIELLVVPSDGLSHLVRLCKDIALTIVQDLELPDLLQCQSHLQEPIRTMLIIFYKQVAYTRSEHGKRMLEHVHSIVQKRFPSNLLYQFLAPLIDVPSLLFLLFINSDSTYLINVINFSMYILYEGLQHLFRSCLQDRSSNSDTLKYAPESAEVQAGQVLSLLIYAIINLKGAFVLSRADTELLTIACTTRIDGFLQLIFEHQGLSSITEEMTTSLAARCLSFILATEIDLLEAIKRLCKDDMLAVDTLSRCIQDIRLSYRVMIEESPDNESLFLASPYLTLVRTHKQAIPPVFPSTSYKCVSSTSSFFFDKCYLTKMDSTFRGRRLTIDTSSRVSFTYTIGSFSIMINSYVLLMLLLLFVQTLDNAHPPRLNKFLNDFFVKYCMENTLNFRTLVAKLVLAITFDVPFACLSKTGHPAGYDNTDYTSSFITAFEDIARFLSCSSITTFGNQKESLQQFGTLFIYFNPYFREVITLLIEQKFDLYDSESNALNIYFNEYIAQTSEDGSTSNDSGLIPFKCLDEPTRRRYTTQNSIFIKAELVQRVKKSHCSLVQIYENISDHWVIDLDTTKAIMSELIDTGALDVDEQGLYVYVV